MLGLIPGFDPTISKPDKNSVFCTNRKSHKDKFFFETEKFSSQIFWCC
jgi:hypothetical protein